MQRSFNHEITFQGANSLTIQDIADSLVANEQVILHVGKVLEELFEGLTVEKVSVQFRSVSVNSPLKETLLIAIVSAFQPQINEVTKQIVKDITGIEMSDGYAAIVTVLFFVVLIYGIDWAYKRFKAPKDDGKRGETPSLAITGSYNSVLQIGGNLIGLPPSKIAEAVEAAIKPQHKDGLAKRALKFIRPAKSNPGASIEGGGVVFPAEAIADAPSDADMEMADDVEDQTPYQNCRIEIHATDRDSKKSGWAAHLPGIYEKRIKMQLYPTIDPKELFGKTSVRADVILTSKRLDTGEWQPYLVHVLKVNADD